mmetsp:Transcript_16981/g.44233  ORF Transcript_16981/g.44233 Transcript_16981/m.44233 type:complete len:280 (-) Transcript_16981:266-1105(-)
MDARENALVGIPRVTAIDGIGHRHGSVDIVRSSDRQERAIAKGDDTGVVRTSIVVATSRTSPCPGSWIGHLCQRSMLHDRLISFIRVRWGSPVVTRYKKVPVEAFDDSHNDLVLDAMVRPDDLGHSPRITAVCGPLQCSHDVLESPGRRHGRKVVQNTRATVKPQCCATLTPVWRIELNSRRGPFFCPRGQPGINQSDAPTRLATVRGVPVGIHAAIGTRSDGGLVVVIVERERRPISRPVHISPHHRCHGGRSPLWPWFGSWSVRGRWWVGHRSHHPL